MVKRVLSIGSTHTLMLLLHSALKGNISENDYLTVSFPLGLFLKSRPDKHDLQFTAEFLIKNNVLSFVVMNDMIDI